MLFTAAVIGLGKIGQEYDYHITDATKILTHANAFMHHPGYKLIAGVDSDPNQCKKFEEKFKCKAYSSIAGLYSDINPDVVVIATPSSDHFSTFLTLSQYTPHAIICEKPLAADLAHAKQMIQYAETNNISLLVNYIRRCEPGVLAMRNKIKDGAIGEIYKVTGRYSKGILNNGSHMIDLLHFVLGGIDQVRILKKGRKWQNADPEPDVYCQSGNVDIYLLAAKEEHFSLFDIEFIGTEGIIKYLHGGRSIQLFKSKDDKDFKGYKSLAEESENIPHNYYLYQHHVLDNLYQHLTTSQPIFSSGFTAYKTLEIINQIITSIEED